MISVGDKRVRINICILTYRRPDLLGNCLQSLTGLREIDGVELLVTVIENDTEQLSRPLVEQFDTQGRFEIHYRCEPQRGIPVARNNALEFCLAEDCDYVVFIDDDEWVDTDWLSELYSYCQQQGGDIVVSGKVIPIFPENTPPEISGLIKAKERPTGTHLTACATNNVIFPIRLARELGLRFDTSVPLAGGTDTKFFFAAHQLGVEIKKCDEAVVFERIPESRARIKWMQGRKYRAGITETWRRRQQGQGAAKILASALFSIISNLIKTLVFTCIGRKLKRNQAWLRVHKALGACAGLRGKEVESYKVTD